MDECLDDIPHWLSRHAIGALVVRILQMIDEQPKPKPFLKWVGGKSQLLPELLKRIPKTWNRETDFYVEPFVGAGALFWELQPAHAILNDANEELINVWHVLQCRDEELIAHLHELAASYVEEPERLYYEIRDLSWQECRTNCTTCGASRTILLNKAGFNGLYRGC
jgi:DNA adenine methylase